MTQAFQTSGSNLTIFVSAFGLGITPAGQQANTVGPATALRTFGFVAAGGALYGDLDVSTVATGGALPAIYGGTAQTTYATGDTLYASAANTLAKLAGNTSTAKQFLTGTGTGSASQAPAWGTIASADLPIGSQFLTAATTANRSTTSGTLVNVTDLSLALAAGATYEFEAHLSVNASAVTGNQYGVNFSAAGATVEAQIFGTLAASTMQCGRISALNTASATYDTAGADGGLIIKGRLTTTSNAGNLTIQHLAVVAATTTALVYAGSSLTARRVA